MPIFNDFVAPKNGRVQTNVFSGASATLSLPTTVDFGSQSISLGNLYSGPIAIAGVKCDEGSIYTPAFMSPPCHFSYKV